MDSARIDAADAILEQGNVAVYKTTRSGFKNSAIYAAHRRGLKVLVVSPTTELLSQTVLDAVKKIGGVYCNIPGNQGCKYVQKKIKKDKFLREMPIPKGKCSECDDYATCSVTEIERIEKFTIVTMTYAKLEAIVMSKKERERIGEKLADIDLVIFDEAHTISFPSLPQVDFDKDIKSSADSDFLAFFGAYKKFCQLRTNNKRYVESIKNATEANPDRYAGFQVEIPYPSSAKNYHLQLEQLLEVAELRGELWPKDVADDQVLALKSIVSIMGGKKATISYKKEGDAGKMIVMGGLGNIERAIQFFLSNLVPKAKVCFVSGTLIEHKTGFFSELAGREVKNVIFPDLCKTNAKMHIHPSKWRFSDFDSDNGIERAIKEIREIYERIGRRQIYLIAMNQRIKDQLKKELIGCGNIIVDYYRSKNTMGVEQPQRICIAVGLAHTPRHTCDPLALGADDLERYLDTQQLRRNEVHAATWQAWSRVKDPNGKVESHIYCVGVRAD